MSSLPQDGELTYNGFTFPVETQTESVRITPVPDETGRTVVYSTFALTVRTWLNRPASQNRSAWEAEVAGIRRALTHYGQPLVYVNKGIGQISVNVGTGGTKDVNWGPKPRVLMWKPLGGGNAIELVWSVETSFPDCANATFTDRIMEFGFSVSYAVDYAGYNTRTISGYFKIPNNRFSPNVVAMRDSPDYYISQVEPALIPGFQRTYGPRTIDPSKTRLDFSFIDTELGMNYPPEWVAKISASHDVSSTQRGLNFWNATIDAEYELTKAAPDRWSPWKHFMGVLCKDRIAFTAKNIGADSTGIIPVMLRLNEPEIYGRRKYRFSLTYTFSRSLDKIASATGLWRAVPGSNWTKWSASLLTSAFKQTGYANLTLSLQSDRIVDLCGPPGTNLPGSGGGVGTNVPNQQTPNQNEQQRLISSIAPVPDEDKSWIQWVCTIEIETDSGSAAVRTLPSETPTVRGEVFGPNGKVLQGRDLLLATLEIAKQKGPPTGNQGGSGGAASTVSATDAKSQAARIASPACYITLVGYATRAHFAIPPPFLTKVNGVDAVEANRLDRGEGFRQAPTFAGATGPIYTASWRIRYALAAIPEGELQAPPSPIMNPPQ